MALIKKLDSLKMARNLVHSEVTCTYSVFSDDDGSKYIQIDTYGSPERELKGKKSQSVQLGPEAIMQLRAILKQEF